MFSTVSGHVETCVLLGRKSEDDMVYIDYSPKGAETIKDVKTSATYREIKEWIYDKYFVKVHTAHIAQIKSKCGIAMGECYNKSKVEGARTTGKCPKDKERMIKEAFKHFNMI